MNYQDEWGGWNATKLNDKNKFIYGAISKYLGLDVSTYPELFNKCKPEIKKGFIKFNRTPIDSEPPISPEEFIGAIVLGLIPYDIAKSNHFYFMGKGKKASVKDLEKIATGLLKLYMSHQLNIFMPKSKKIKQRNLFWKHEIQELYGLAFRLNPAYVYAIKRANNKDTHEEERLLFKLYVDCTLSKRKSKFRGDQSQVMILWVLANYMQDYGLANKCRIKDILRKYFPADHNFNRAML